MIASSVIPTNGRNKIVDMTWPYIFDTTAFLIPVADDEANITAIIKPFQWPVMEKDLYILDYFIFILQLCHWRITDMAFTGDLNHLCHFHFKPTTEINCGTSKETQSMY